MTAEAMPAIAPASRVVGGGVGMVVGGGVIVVVVDG